MFPAARLKPELPLILELCMLYEVKCKLNKVRLLTMVTVDFRTLQQNQYRYMEEKSRMGSSIAKPIYGLSLQSTIIADQFGRFY